MIANHMQQKILSSKKRIIIVTAQAGAGSTTGLIMKLAQEASKNDNNLGVYIRRTSQQTTACVQNLLRNISGSKWSPKSNILAFKYLGKKIKIKMMCADEVNVREYIPCLAIDMGSHFSNISEMINASGRVIICDFACHVSKKDSWAYSTGLLDDVNGKPTWKPFVDHIVGYNYDNPGLSKDYRNFIDDLPNAQREYLMGVDI